MTPMARVIPSDAVDAVPTQRIDDAVFNVIGVTPNKKHVAQRSSISARQ